MPTNVLLGALQHKWQLLGLATTVYVFVVCIYRRYFHPLSKIPGPFLPAVTKLYQTYYNGKYFEQVDLLHQKYGPIVRITPDEVHLANIEDYDQIYHNTSRYSKGANFYDSMCVKQSTFGTASNEVSPSHGFYVQLLTTSRCIASVEAP